MMFDRIQRGLWWDKTLSLVSGCTPVSEACENCWLAQETAMRGVQNNFKIKARYGGLTTNGKFTGEVREMWDDLQKITPKQKPAVWAVWSDLFHENVTWDFQYKAIERMMLCCKQHLFVVCTKRPEIMQKNLANIIHHLGRNYKYLGIVVPNVMCMTTTESQSTYDERISYIVSTESFLKALSIEPLIEPVDLKNLLHVPIDWVIVGCESGRNARPMNLDWVRSIRDQCVSAGVPFFFKQAMVDGKLVKAPFLDGQQWLQTPEVNKFGKTDEQRS